MAMAHYKGATWEVEVVLRVWEYLNLRRARISCLSYPHRPASCNVLLGQVS